MPARNGEATGAGAESIGIAVTYTQLALSMAFQAHMAQRTKVLLLIPHLGGGGAEQVTSLLARGLARERYEVHLGVVTQGGRRFRGILLPWVWCMNWERRGCAPER